MSIDAREPARYDARMAQVMAAPEPYRFTREDYYRMGEAGLFEGKRVELLDGAIVAMSPQSSPHASAVMQAQYALIRAVGSAFLVRVQLPIVLDHWSEPEPDLAVCLPDPARYQHGHPIPSQVAMVVEIALSSLAYDREQKGSAYARAGIPVYVVEDVEERVADVLSDPDPVAGTYRRRDAKAESDLLHLPGGASVAVAELLPPR